MRVTLTVDLEVKTVTGVGGGTWSPAAVVNLWGEKAVDALSFSTRTTETPHPKITCYATPTGILIGTPKLVAALLPLVEHPRRR